MEEWAALHASSTPKSSIFDSATITYPPEATSLSFSRAYSLALAPQLIHARSLLLSQLVSSGAYRQIEFLSVGSFFIFKPPSGPTSTEPTPGVPTLTRIPSTREDVFSTRAIGPRAKRSLMKFLKFVLDYDSEAHRSRWQPHATSPLADFLEGQFGLDTELQMLVLTMTLALSRPQHIATCDGLAAVHRHLTSMGMFGPGFAAVYPKWGGISEIAQVACRAGAVGGGVYMLGTGIRKVVEQRADGGKDGLEIELASGVSVKTKMLVGADETLVEGGEVISRLTTVVGSPLKFLFDAVMEGTPIPAVAVVVFPSGSLTTEAGKPSEYPVYALAHSSDAGECPAGQSVLYLTTISTPESKNLLHRALQSLLTAIPGDDPPRCLFQLYYQQSRGSGAIQLDNKVAQLPSPSLNLAFDDSVLESVHQAWKMAMGPASEEAEAEYMVFPDREGAGQYGDDYE